MTGASTQPAKRRPSQRRDVVIAAACGVVVASMVGAAYAAVPLYNWFCRTTGFGGTTQVSAAAPDKILGRAIKVRFDSNTARGLPWRFEPEVRTVDARIGEVITVHYKVVNRAARETAGQASYNVTPPIAGGYFNKINCFCFTEQRLGPGEKRDMTVVFYLDPALVEDSDLDVVNTITLSYTMFPADNPTRPVADNPATRADERS